ncbi:MAG TPA: tetratricopeptide repeat protein [Opitutaceae bacterium]|nr:tetratricopeptide repeat protein [Opitutaceae bacterium]
MAAKTPAAGKNSGAPPSIGPIADSRTERCVLASRRAVVGAGVLVVLAAWAAYANSFSGPLVFDDPEAITNNPTIRHLGSAWWPPPAGTTGGRPLLNFTFALNYALGGARVWGYHAVNLLIHALAGLVLFGLVRRTLRGPALKERFGAAALPLALAVAVIWVVHPLQTEAVTYLSERAESLMGLFYLLAIYCFVRGAEDPEGASQNTEARNTLAARFWLPASVLSCLLGVMSKEIIATAPVLVMFYDRTFVAGSFRAAWRRRRGYYLGLAGTWLALAYLMTGLRQRGAGFSEGVTAWSYALTSCRSVALYLKLAVWPCPLVLDYGPDMIHRVGAALPYALILATAMTAVAVAIRRRPAAGFAGMCFFLILAPTSSVVPVIGQPTAEHRAYLSLAAVISWLGPGLYRLVGRRSFVLLALLAAGLGGLSVRRNEDYRSAETVWRDTVAKCPRNARALNNLGYTLSAMPGRLPEAVAAYQAALHLRPDYAEAHNNLGAALTSLPGRLPEAIDECEAALRLDPDYAKAHNNLAHALVNVPGRLPEAIAECETALRLDPDYAIAHNNLGAALSRLPGRMPDAIAEYQAALRIDPDYAEAHDNLGMALAGLPGRLPEAITEYQAALRLEPDYAKAHDNLGMALAKIPGRLPEAVAEFEAALRFDPQLALAHNNLGAALSKTPQQLPAAIAEYRAALRLDPANAEAHYNLGNALMNVPGQTAEAVAEFEAVLRIDPNRAEAHNNLGCALAVIPGRTAEAIMHLQAAVRLKPDYAEAHYNLGNTLMDVPGRTAEAMAEFEAALRTDPGLAPAREKLDQLRAAPR